MVTWTGLTDFHHGIAYGIQNDRPTHRRKIARLMFQKQMRVDKELLDTLIGAAAGGAALDNFNQVDDDASFTTTTEAGFSVQRRTIEPGGNRTITARELINRVSTAADITALKRYLVPSGFRPNPYVEDLSGNGGGGKVGF